MFYELMYQENLDTKSQQTTHMHYMWTIREKKFGLTASETLGGFSFDPLTKKLWLADVGQGKLEEITIVEKGDNLGWRLFEGNLPF